MKNSDRMWWTAWAGVLALFVFLPPILAAPMAGQTLDLHPGWNAVFLEVQPSDNTPASVFGSLPVSSVWTWLPRQDTAEFTRNVSETMYNDSRWLAYFPSNRYESMFTSLHRLYANRAYLIKLAGTNPVTATVTGVPAAPRYAWKPNVFHLTGFPLNPAGPLPALGGFLSPSPELTGQPVYRLDAEGHWNLVVSPLTSMLQSGEAMWVQAAGETDYMGPVSVRTGDGSGLEYAGVATEKKVTVANLSTNAVTVRIRDASGAGGPLAYWSMAGGEVVWNALPDPLTVVLAAGESYTLRLAVRREQMTDEIFETVIEFTSDIGTRVRIPLSAQKTVTL